MPHQLKELVPLEFDTLQLFLKILVLLDGRAIRIPVQLVVVQFIDLVLVLFFLGYLFHQIDLSEGVVFSHQLIDEL